MNHNVKSAAIEILRNLFLDRGGENLRFDAGTEVIKDNRYYGLVFNKHRNLFNEYNYCGRIYGISHNNATIACNTSVSDVNALFVYPTFRKTCEKIIESLSNSKDITSKFVLKIFTKDLPECHHHGGDLTHYKTYVDFIVKFCEENTSVLTEIYATNDQDKPNSFVQAVVCEPSEHLVPLINSLIFSK